MAKLTRVPAKVFAASAAADEIGQFGSAVAGSKLETADVATIQGLSAWLDGWSEALVSSNRYPALQEMNGLLKVLSYQGAYALQEGISEYDANTSYYIGSIVKKTGTFELYGSKTDNNVGKALSDGANWKLLVDLNACIQKDGSVDFTAEQKGVDAINATGLTTLQQVQALDYTSNTANMPILANNASDANNDIDFTSGFCFDLSTLIKIANSALTKRLDANFVAGTNQGGLDTGAKANSTWYYCFAISKADGTSDFLYSTSKTSPIMPSGFVNKRRIGSIRTNSSGNIIGFKQDANTFFFFTPPADINILPVPTTRTNYTVSVPPSMTGIFAFYAYSSAGTQSLHYFQPTFGGVWFVGVSQFGTPPTNPTMSLVINIPCDGSSQVSYYSDVATSGMVASTLGFIDNRGAN